jgi:hypothetical protein
MWFNWLTYGVGIFTDCRVSISYQRGHGACAKFEGDETDVEYAVWLAKNLRDMCRKEATAYYGCRAEKEAFRKGFCSRIQARMKALAAERKVELSKAVTSTGTALILVNQKLALRDEVFGAQMFKTTRAKRGYGWSDGHRAGDKANFNRPLGGNKTNARLGVTA